MSASALIAEGPNSDASQEIEPIHDCEMGRKRVVARPIAVVITLNDGGELITGKEKLELGHLQGSANVLGQLLFSDTYSVLNRAKAEWIVRQQSGTTVTVTAGTAKAGTVHTELMLP